MLREGTHKYVGKTGSRGPVRLRASGLAAGRNAHTAPWVYDTYAPPCGTAKSVVGTGRTDRHLIAADPAFGAAMVNEATESISASGKVPGVSKHPFANSDLPFHLPRAPASAADGKFALGVLLPDVKKPSESKEPWKHYPVKVVIPAANAALPLSKSKCRLVQP